MAALRWNISGMEPLHLSTDLAIQTLYALGIGVLIGLERSVHEVTMGDDLFGPGPDEPKACSPAPLPEAPSEGSKQQEAHRSPEYLGVRSFAVLSLVGLGTALVSDRYPLVAPVTLACVSLLLVAMYKRMNERSLGITTEIAAMGTCALGMLCHTAPLVASVLALVITVLLTAKRFTHRTVRKMRRVELTGTIKFLMIIFIALPLLPNQPIDPYGVFNPYKTLFLIILISGISFVGYFLTRFLGPRRGLGITGILGGLASSTALTAAMSNQVKAVPELIGPATAATVAGNATMYVRVLVVVAVLDQALALRLAWPLGVMALVAIGGAVFFWLRYRTHDGGASSPSTSKPLTLQNPFSLGPALKFGVFFVFILFVARLAKDQLGDQGLYLASVVSGLADVDAITLSLLEQTRAGALAQSVATVGITIAVVANSIVKSGIALYTGGWKFGRRVGLCLMAATLAGLAVSLLI